MDWPKLFSDMAANPSPIAGGIVGGLLTGGFFGWISHGRSVRPILIFTRKPEEKSPRWKIQNIGTGPALNIRIRDYKSKNEVAQRIHAYPLMPGNPRSIAWVKAGFKLEADYTDAYGRRRYISIAENNSTTYKRRYWKLWGFRPFKSYLRGYDPEIHEVRKAMKPIE